MVPEWLHILSWAALGVGFGSALMVCADLLKYPQKMWIMNLVWPVTALFGTGLTLWLYHRFGKLKGRGVHSDRETPFAVAVAKGTGHCGAGCTLGDIVAEWLAFFVPVVAVWLGWQSLFGEKMFAVWVLDFIFAFVIGIVFQYFSIAPMRGLGLRDGLVAALKADTLSLTAWQVGMYGFMAVAKFWIFAVVLGADLRVNSPEFWFMMQVAMLAGFVTAYPVNWWLIRTGIKEEM